MLYLPFGTSVSCHVQDGIMRKAKKESQEKCPECLLLVLAAATTALATMNPSSNFRSF